MRERVGAKGENSKSAAARTLALPGCEPPPAWAHRRDTLSSEARRRFPELPALAAVVEASVGLAWAIGVSTVDTSDAKRRLLGLLLAAPARGWPSAASEWFVGALVVAATEGRAWGNPDPAIAGSSPLPSQAPSEESADPSAGEGGERRARPFCVARRSSGPSCLDCGTVDAGLHKHVRRSEAHRWDFLCPTCADSKNDAQAPASSQLRSCKSEQSRVLAKPRKRLE